MRYLDIALATMIGVSAISGILTWNPGAADAGTQRLMLEGRLRDRLVTYISNRGMPWIQESIPNALCADLGRLSNTITISATINSLSCGPSPPRGAVVATLTLHLVSRDVTLQAWSNALG